MPPSAAFTAPCPPPALLRSTLAEISLVSASPEHSRAPEALLAVANCQLELKDAKAARKTYEELIKSYPQSEAAAVGKDRLTKLK